MYEKIIPFSHVTSTFHRSIILQYNTYSTYLTLARISLELLQRWRPQTILLTKKQRRRKKERLVYFYLNHVGCLYPRFEDHILWSNWLSKCEITGLKDMEKEESEDLKHRRSGKHCIRVRRRGNQVHVILSDAPDWLLLGQNFAKAGEPRNAGYTRERKKRDRKES